MKSFFAHKGYKYAKYKQALEFIKNDGYLSFFKSADKWKCAYGKLDSNKEK